MKSQLLFYLQTFKVLGMAGTTDLVGQHSSRFTHISYHIISHTIIAFGFSALGLLLYLKVSLKNMPVNGSPTIESSSLSIPLTHSRHMNGRAHWSHRRHILDASNDLWIDAHVRRMSDTSLPISKFHAPPTHLGAIRLNLQDETHLHLLRAVSV